ncbi:MAG: glycosyltransferase family 2 protein [Methanomicrobiales archaeon]|nr:glycosyltransferase family 2 protein [Methanomicrobiales archaeon]
MEKLVSIIIVNWNGLKYIHECISSLLNQTYNNIEILLVDNASSDESVKYVLDNFPKVRVIQNRENLGFAGGVNIGISHSRGDLIALFNQDAVADQAWLEILVRSLESSEDIAAVAGKVFYYGDAYGQDAVFCTWSKIDPYTAAPYNFYGDEPMAAVDYLTGCALVVKTSVIDEIGLLDTGYFLYFEETDWCARMIRAGYRLMYIPDACVRHVVSGSIQSSYIKSSYLSRNRLRFVLKNFDLIYIPVVFSSFFFETFIDLLKGIKTGNLFDFRIKLESFYWNFINLRSTLAARKRDFARIVLLRSYNKSLPLKNYPIGTIEKIVGSVQVKL